MNTYADSRQTTPEQPTRANVTGIVGLCAVALGTILSPTGFLGCTLPILMLLGFGGMVVCGVSLAWRPRWPGAIGLVVGTLCIGFWAALFGSAFISVSRSAGALGLTVPQHVQMCMSAMKLTEIAESQRTSSGAPAPIVDLSSIPTPDQTDPWGRPYRYVLVNTPRGFTFMSDGPDTVAGTPDDVDILTIQYGGMFDLPPITATAPVRPTQAPASGNQ